MELADLVSSLDSSATHPISLVSLMKLAIIGAVKDNAVTIASAVWQSTQWRRNQTSSGEETIKNAEDSYASDCGYFEKGEEQYAGAEQHD